MYIACEMNKKVSMCIFPGGERATYETFPREWQVFKSADNPIRSRCDIRSDIKHGKIMDYLKERRRSVRTFEEKGFRYVTSRRCATENLSGNEESGMRATTTTDDDGSPTCRTSISR